ncbi:hypothetical protein F2Q70_00045344 [Brassica cretica]|uniref:RNase H type-1 domain-containing protein n=1 Tax=Brassica cretica TaxID=69181 RepID=A0A8S9KFK2_BRACR|nr:hypothetical protein F2Q70_00045344 [Brassica cretica]
MSDGYSDLDSNATTLPSGEFPSSSIYNNFDCLLNRVQKRNGSEDSLGCIPWVLWFIWKAQESDNMDMPELPVRPPRKPLCRFDASWKEDNARFGGGLVIEMEDGITIFGSFAGNRVLSPPIGRVQYFAVGHEILATHRSRLDDF